MADFAVAHLDEVTEIQGSEELFKAVRQHFGITTFGVNVMTGSAGHVVISEHSETHPDAGEELYLVMTGHATFELSGEAHDAPAGTLVHVQPKVRRSATAKEDGTTVLAIGAAAPGKPYEVNGWELFAPLVPLFASGEYEQGADRAQELLADDPPYGVVYYNTACFEARAGRTQDALTHLRRALELSPHLLDLARDDEDLESLRAEPAYAEIVGG